LERLEEQEGVQVVEILRTQAAALEVQVGQALLALVGSRELEEQSLEVAH